MNKEDVAVVGAGSTGASVAYHLSKAGHRVTLIEMDQIGGGTTSRSTANVRTHYSNETLARMALYSLGVLRGMEGTGFVKSGGTLARRGEERLDAQARRGPRGRPG